MSTDTIDVTDTWNQHGLVWMGAYRGNDPARPCGNSQCSLQVGYGKGYVGCNQQACYGGSQWAQTDNLKPYEENGDVNGYNVAFYSSFGLSQNNFYDSYFDGNWSGVNGRYSGWIYNGSSWILMGQAWLPYPLYARVLANWESATFGSDNTCPNLHNYQWFGTNGTSYTDNSTRLMITKNGTTWNYWDNSANAQIYGFTDSPYGATWINSNYSYAAWGG